MILVKARVIVLLPAPVLPTTPTFNPPLTLRLSFLSTRSVDGLYLSSTFSNSSYPLVGQLEVVLSCSLFSYGISSSLKHFWTEASCFSKSPLIWTSPFNLNPRWTTCWRAIAQRIGSAPLNFENMHMVPVIKDERHEAIIRRIAYQVKVAKDTYWTSKWEFWFSASISTAWSSVPSARMVEVPVMISPWWVEIGLPWFWSI